MPESLPKATFSLITLLLLIFSPVHLFALLSDGQADTAKIVLIKSIRIEGNRQTRPSIILREIPFDSGSYVKISVLPGLLRSAQENVFNTRLFNVVNLDTIVLQKEPLSIAVRVHVIERWYIWPIPFFEISDRNFNTWLETMDFSRLTFGIDLAFFNVRGHNETLMFPIHFGFNQMFGFSYRIPYLDKRKIFGMGFGGGLSRNHEIIVGSVNNKTVYYKDPENFPRQSIYGFTELTVRPGIFSRHTLRLGYQYFYFSDSVAKIPDYLPDTLSQTGFFSLYYQYKNDHRDVHFYPLKGFYFDAELFKNGFFGEPLNDFYIKSSFRKYWQLHKRWYFATGIFGKLMLSKNQPYLLQRGLGYGREYVRGYEYYVIDGQNFLLLKNNLKFAVLPWRVFVIGSMKNTRFNTIPYSLYINVFTDLGYVYNESSYRNFLNSLQNSLLVGYGAGLDFATYYDIVIRLEFALNGLGEPGIYLHFIAPI